jgi:hypothetical protein
MIKLYIVGNGWDDRGSDSDRRFRQDVSLYHRVQNSFGGSGAVYSRLKSTRASKWPLSLPTVGETGVLTLLPHMTPYRVAYAQRHYYLLRNF